MLPMFLVWLTSSSEEVSLLIVVAGLKLEDAFSVGSCDKSQR